MFVFISHVLLSPFPFSTGMPLTVTGIAALVAATVSLYVMVLGLVALSAFLCYRTRPRQPERKPLKNETTHSSSSSTCSQIQPTDGRPSHIHVYDDMNKA